MNRPFALFTVFFCLGVIAGTFAGAPFWAVFLTAAVFLFFSFLSVKKGISFYVFISCLVFFLGACFLKNCLLLPKSHISRYAYSEKGDLCLIKGVVCSEPAFKYDLTSFVFKTEEAQFGAIKYKCCGKVLVYACGRRDLYYADRLILRGNLCKPAENFNRNQKSYAGFLYNKGIFLIARIKTQPGIVKLNKNKIFSMRGFAFGLKEKIEGLISKHTSILTANILEAMILGEQDNVPPSIYNSMVLTGTVHVLVVSGFNVGIVAFIVILLLKFLRLPRRIRFCFAIPIIIIYCLMTGSSNPVIRATIMAIFFMLGFLLKREPDIYNSLSLAALFILAINPLQLFEIGFQLSFASVLSIVYLYPRIKSLLGVASIKPSYLRFLADGCVVSLSAWLGTMGIIAYYFRMFSPVTVLANIFIVPLATLITLCGLSLVLMALVYPPIAPLFAVNCELLTVFLLRINDALLKIPGASLRL